MSKATQNTIEKALKVYEIVKQHYEEGNQSRCQRQVFKKHVLLIYPMSEPTFWRLMKIAQIEKQKRKIQELLQYGTTKRL